MTNVKFNKNKSAAYAMSSGTIGTIYFTNDTHEIVVDGQSYSSNYTLPVATSDNLGGVRLGYTQSGKNYPIILDSNNKAYVNVPWTDTVYTLPAATSSELGGIKIGYTQSGKNYPVVLDSNNKAYVNVPWTDTVPNNGKLSITGGGTTLIEFTADQSVDKTLNVKGTTGVSVSGSDGQMIISSDSNHTVTSKTGIVERGGTQTGDQAYELNVVCDLSGETVKTVDLNDFADLDYNTSRTFNWSKSANEQNVYLGLFMVGSASSGFAFKLDIQNTSTGKTESHLYGLLVDTPSDTTFMFASTNSWSIICKQHLQDGNVLLAYLQVPDDFVGTIKLIPLKYRNGYKDDPKCFEPTSASDNVPHLYSWSADGDVNLATYTSSNIYGNNISGTIREPYGNYPVDVIGDFGGNIVVGSKVSDSIINDYFLHTLGKKVNNIIENGDTKVKQSAINTTVSMPYPLLLSQTVNPVSGTAYESLYSTSLGYNPYTSSLSTTNLAATNVNATNLRATAELSAHILKIAAANSDYSTKQIFGNTIGTDQNLRIWNPAHPVSTETSAIQLMVGGTNEREAFGSFPASVEISSTPGQTANGSGKITVNASQVQLNGGVYMLGVNLRGTKSGDTYTLNVSDGGISVTNSTIDSKKVIRIKNPYSVMSFHDLTMGQVLFYFDSAIPEGTTITLFNHENSSSGQWILTNGTPTQVHLTSGRMYVLRLGGTFTYSGVTGRIVYEAGTTNVLTQP